MAQAYPYPYKGQLRTKQNKCRNTGPLDKPRIWLDFNELCDTDMDTKAPIYLFSQADIVNDSGGNDVELYDGINVSVFDDDLDISGMPDAILADGVVIGNYLAQYPQVKWLIRLVKHQKNVKSGEEYVYWMSDLS